MADAPDPITSPPGRDFQPWDPTADGSTSGWEKLPGGPCDWNGQLTGEDFPDGPGPWRQC